MGDATWAALFPTQFSALSLPLPCYNVRDLHSVDSVVGPRVAALLAAPGSWDVAVGHYLGVDHAGHAHGVGSPEMGAKLAQIDADVAAAVEALVAGAAPGGPYHRTLLLVAGDHGAPGYLTALLCCCWWGGQALTRHAASAPRPYICRPDPGRGPRRGQPRGGRLGPGSGRPSGAARQQARRRRRGRPAAGRRRGVPCQLHLWRRRQPVR